MLLQLFKNNKMSTLPHKRDIWPHFLDFSPTTQLHGSQVAIPTELAMAHQKIRTFVINTKRKPSGWQVCEEGLLELWPQLYDKRPQIDGDAAGGHNERSLSLCICQPYGFLLCHGFF